MAKHNRHISLLIIPHFGPKKFAIKLSEGAFYSVLMAGAAFVIIFVFLFLSYGDLYLRTVRLSRRNAQLEKEHVQVVALEKEVRQMQELEQKVKVMLGQEKQPPPLDLSAPTGQLTQAASGEENRQFQRGEFSSPEMAALFNEQEMRRRSLPTIWPVHGWLTQEFKGAGLQHGEHPGLDIAAPRGAAVLAAADGIVTFAGWDEIYGNLVVLDHGLGFQTKYGHNSQVVVREGETVKRGQLIGFVGSTGRSTAPHLHYEVLLNGKPVDPRTYVVN